VVSTAGTDIPTQSTIMIMSFTVVGSQSSGMRMMESVGCVGTIMQMLHLGNMRRVEDTGMG